MNELQVQSVCTAPPPERRWWRRATRWMLFAALVAMLGAGGGWTAWAWKQEQDAARQQAIEEQRQRQDEAMNEVLRQLAAVRAELAAQPKQALPDEPRKPAPAAESARVQFRMSAVKPEPKPKRGLVKFLTSSIVVDSAVLASSVLVPPSLPLTLAQSRLGRRLTGRIFKKTKTEKTVAAKIVRDVEDMPVTRRRRR